MKLFAQWIMRLIKAKVMTHRQARPSSAYRLLGLANAHRISNAALIQYPNAALILNEIFRIVGIRLRVYLYIRLLVLKLII